MTTEKDNFDEISVGDEAEIIHRITSDDLETFVSLTGDDNPIHVDEDYASQTMLGRTIVHGMLSASFISTLIGTKLPGRGALWYEQHTRFVEPVHVGETIHVCARVKQKSSALRLMILDVVVYNDEKRRVVECEAKVRVLKPLESQRSP